MTPGSDNIHDKGGDGTSEGVLQNLAEKVKNSDFDKMENGNEVYHTEGGARVKISSQKAADMIIEANQDLQEQKDFQKKEGNNTVVNPEISPTDEAKEILIHRDENKPYVEKESPKVATDGITPLFQEGTLPQGPYKAEGIPAKTQKEIFASPNQSSTNKKDLGNYSIDGVTPLAPKNITPQEPYKATGIPLRTQKDIALEKLGEQVEESSHRQDILNRFRDQANIGQEESVPKSNPSRVSTQEEQQIPARPSAIQYFRDQTILNAGESIPPATEPGKMTPSTEEVELTTEEELSEQLSSINAALEKLNSLRNQYPDNPEIQRQIDKLISNISISIENLTPSEETPSFEGTIEPEQEADSEEEPNAIIPAPADEIIDIQAIKEEEQKMLEKARERKDRKTAIIATVVGGVTGVGTALAVGASAVPQVRVVAGVLAVAATGTTFAAKFIENKTFKQLQTETDPEKIAKLQKRLENWRKVGKWARTAGSFLGGFTLGLWGGSIISSKFMGGYGFLNRPPVEVSTPSTPGLPSENISPQGESSVTQSRTPNAPTSTVTATEIPSISPAETGLIQNGRVNLPGSAWNGNLAGNPIEGASELMSRSFVGGQTNMAAFHLNKDLAEAGLKLTDLTSRIGTEGVHSLLNGYFNAIRGGTANPVLKTILQSSNITGASDVLSMIP